MKIEEWVEGASSAAILGHIHPDGDCVGSCLGLRSYLRTVKPALRVQVYLEPFAGEFHFLTGADAVSPDFCEEKSYDVCFALDCSDRERLGDAVRYLDAAKRTVCVDHHITNEGFADVNVIRPQASSTSEVLAELMEPEKVDQATAECLYLGIVHDTGVFKHSNTSERTMQIAGALLAKGVSSSQIIDDTFYRKTFAQNRILGCALLAAELRLDGRLIASCVTGDDLARCGVTNRDLDGIIDQLRVTEGVEVAVFLYEAGAGEFKVSLRSNDLVDVSRIARSFGGGGHVKAAGCTASGACAEILERITALEADELRQES
ncbi:MAG: bifunctional oligoribonuclease/PAP phosphatase NrnA [Lachnospiraceae bacterium]|nr:bifunctional oligoribonuclease/PAP phosphatase NrnA [Lachnospiraceae bacterium]